MAERALEIIAEGHQSVYVFSPRTGHPQIKTPAGEIIYGADYAFDGKADLLRGNGNPSDHATIIATGIPVHHALEAADRLRGGQEHLSVRVLNVSCIRPLDAAAIIQAALETSHVIVAEDHNSEGGLASQVADVIADFALPCSLRRLGLHHYFPSAPAEELEFLAGLDTESICNAILDEVHTETRGGEDALVTVIHELVSNMRQSRFREGALPFVEKLLREKRYLDTLRESFAKHECPKEKLPRNRDLLQKLEGLLGGE
jgi:TPP-dependent indolepyruvate ferredoxin oxidoreductase alpha subunit